MMHMHPYIQDVFPVVGRSPESGSNEAQSIADGESFASLKDCPPPVEVVNLIINPRRGVGIIDDMKALSIKNVWIQPGAASPEILQKCAESGIAVHQGCVLVELTPSPSL